MQNDKQALNLFKTYMVLGPDYQRERGPKPIFPKSIVHEIMQYAQYEDWTKTAEDLAVLLKRKDMNYITQSESWAQDSSLNDFKKWLANPDQPRISESYDFFDKTIMPLIKFIAKSPLVDEESRTALMWTAYYGHAEALKAMLAVPGIDVNAVSVHGWPAIMYAVINDQTEALQVLLALPGIDVNAVNKYGCTALMMAAGNGHTEALRALLVIPGIKTNAVNHNGHTASMAAAHYGQTEAKQLIDNHFKQETAFSRKIFF